MAGKKRAMKSKAAAPDRVQGQASDLDDLTLRSGEGLLVEIGGGITGTPTLRRTTGGGSTISFEVRDDSLDLLDLPLLSEDWQAELDGLDFSYLGTKKAGVIFTLGLEESAIAALRKLKGPKKVQARRGQPDEVTRAEFVISLIEEARPKIPFFCPQLHEKQPIRTREQGNAAKADARANRDKGIGDTKGLTVKGEDATAEQVDLVDRALRTAESNNAPPEVALALYLTLAVESVAGDASSNLVGMTPETEAGSKYSATVVEEASAGFLLGYVSGHEGALEVFRKKPGLKPYEIAQAVQKSGAGKASNGKDNYGEWEDEGREWLDAFGGGTLGDGGGSATSTVAYYFEVKKNETYWDAIKRLAKDVNWRAFFVAGRFFYIDEEELARGMVRLAIERERGATAPKTQGVEDVDFDFNGNKPVTEITITALAKEWSVPPGSVITLAGYGPASLGDGSPPPRRGVKAAVSAARKANAPQRARYVVTSIEGALTGDAEIRLLTIKAHKPTKPLGEPPNATKSEGGDADTGAAAGEADERVQAVRDYCERNLGRGYTWGSYDCSAFVSYALEAGGVLDGRLTTSGFTSWGEAGEGEFITVHDKAGTGNPRTEHVIIEVLGQLYECGGVSGGVGKPPAGYEKDFPTKRHPKGY